MLIFSQISVILLISKFLNIYLTESELYIPYSDYDNPSINSIHGTGNRTLDKIYRERCAQLCGEKTYSDDHCCEGNTLEEEKCLSFKRCQEILDNFQRYVMGIALISYLCLMAITMVVVFIVYYCYTADKDYKCKNAYSSATIILFAATILPIIILQIYCWKKLITIEEFFGAKFDKCFNISKSLQSVDVNENIPERRTNENENENDYNFSDNYKEKPPNYYELDNNVNGQKSSQRSVTNMLGKNDSNKEKINN